MRILFLNTYFSADFNYISKHCRLRQKYSATRRIFNSLLLVFWKCGLTVRGPLCLILFYTSPVTITEKLTMKLFEVNFAHAIRVRESITMHSYV